MAIRLYEGLIEPLDKSFDQIFGSVLTIFLNRFLIRIGTRTRTVRARTARTRTVRTRTVRTRTVGTRILFLIVSPYC